MATDFFAGVNDRLPALLTTFEDNNGPIDLTGATVVFYARKKGGTTLIGGTATVATDQVTNKGQVSYSLKASDTLTAGTYFAQWVATIGGKNVTAPNSGADKFWVNEFWGSVNE